MTNFYDIKPTGSEPPEGNDRPSLPARFQINGWLKLDEKLWLYDVFDQIAGQPARLWLEEINLQPEAYQSRAISLQKLSHGNLLPVYNHFMWGENGKKYYVCVAKAPGQDYVNSRMLIASSPGINVVGQIARQLALALLYCHSQKVLHGNLQPSFIWVGRDGTVRLELFGALPNRRHALKNETQDSFSNSLLNAPYASPELFGSNASFNAQTDLYALGVIIYEMLAGFNPFLASSDMVSGLRHMYKAVPPLHEINPEVGPGLEKAVMTALYKNPEGRYHNVLELLSQFEIGLATTLQSASQPVRFQTIEQLLENYTALNNEVHTFLKRATPPLAAPSILEGGNFPPTSSQETKKEPELDKGKSAPPYNSLPTSPVERGQVVASTPVNTAAISNNILRPGATSPVIAPAAPPTATALASRPDAVPATRVETAKPAPVTKRQRAKWPNLVPWLLVLNLFFMGYLAWLLLNSVDTSGSGLPTAYPTIPARVVFTPVLGATPTPTPTPAPGTAPVTPTAAPPVTIKVRATVPPPVTNNLPPTPAPTTPAPGGSVPTINDPRVLTALAPTVTAGLASNEPVATIQLVTDDAAVPAPVPTETPANPG